MRKAITFALTFLVLFSSCFRVSAEEFDSSCYESVVGYVNEKGYWSCCGTYRTQLSDVCVTLKMEISGYSSSLGSSYDSISLTADLQGTDSEKTSYTVSNFGFVIDDTGYFYFNPASGQIWLGTNGQKLVKAIAEADTILFALAGESDTYVFQISEEELHGSDFQSIAKSLMELDPWSKDNYLTYDMTQDGEEDHPLFIIENFSTFGQ